MAPAAHMDVTYPAPGAAAIAISGDVTAACEDDLMAAHERASDGGAKLVVLDFSQMEYMNSGGIGMLVTLLVRGQRRQQRIAAVGSCAVPRASGDEPPRPGKAAAGENCSPRERG